MSYNEPEGNNSFLNDDDMICQHCDHKDDVSNGEYHDHMWYCDDCFKELFKVCPKCNVCVISVDEEMCEDCLAEKTYDESAEGMFGDLGFTQTSNTGNSISYSRGIQDVLTITFDKPHQIVNFMKWDYKTSSCRPFFIRPKEVEAITQQMKELGWL